MPGALARHREGEAFCARDFERVTSPANAKNLLARYAADGLLERLLPGVYCLTPEGATVFAGEGSSGCEVGASETVYPDAEDVAEALARLRGWTIAPAGRTALAKLGIVPADAGFLTYASTGSSLEYDYRGTAIVFTHGRTRELVGIGELTRLVVQALRESRGTDASGNATGAIPGISTAAPSMNAVIESMAHTFSSFQIAELERDAPQLVKWLRDAIGRIVRSRDDAMDARRPSVAGSEGHQLSTAAPGVPSSRKTAGAEGPKGSHEDYGERYRLDPSLLDPATETFRSVLIGSPDARPLRTYSPRLAGDRPRREAHAMRSDADIVSEVGTSTRGEGDPR